jgi:hypothetical protein
VVTRGYVIKGQVVTFKEWDEYLYGLHPGDQLYDPREALRAQAVYGSVCIDDSGVWHPSSEGQEVHRLWSYLQEESSVPGAKMLVTQPGQEEGRSGGP